MGNIQVAVLMGGISKEREVSLSSGKEIIAALEQVSEVDVLPIDVTLETIPQLPNLLVSTDVVLNILHGTFGEDGSVQGLLELLNIPYVGSGVLASALAMDKSKSRIIYEAAGLTVPEVEHILKKNDPIPTDISLPVVIKPNASGSSLGVTICKSSDQIDKAINEAFAFDDTVIIDRYIQGREFTCGVLGEGPSAYALPVTEITPVDKEFYNYESKYEEGGSKHTVPADISSEQTKMIQEQALIAHNELGCRDMSRTDFILSQSNILYILETNTLPGMTATSLLPEAAKANGMDFPTFLTDLINKAYNRSNNG